jgi:hypothetical protein
LSRKVVECKPLAAAPLATIEATTAAYINWQGLTYTLSLVHFSAQPEPSFCQSMTPPAPSHPPQKVCNIESESARVIECKPLVPKPCNLNPRPKKLNPRL